MCVHRGMTFLSRSFSTSVLKILNFSNASPFSFNRIVHMYLVWSSIITNIYLFFEGVCGVIGPHRSACSSSSTREDLHWVTFGKTCRVCFPTRHDSQSSFSHYKLGIPRTISCSDIAFIVLKLMCPCLACHLHVSSLILESKQTVTLAKSRPWDLSYKVGLVIELL